MRRLRILTWHVHGSYLDSLGLIGHELIVPWKPGRPESYGGRPANVTWSDSIVEVPAEAVRDLDIDLILFQSQKNYLEDQFEILGDAQRRLPRIYLEHDPPRGTPTDTKHIVDDPDVLLVHVTGFNDLMWDSGRTPTRVIDHGVAIPDGVSWSGELDRGILAINDLASRGRRLGADIFLRARGEVSLDLVGMRSERFGGLGDVPRDRLSALMSRYRFYFHPVRYTSLAMALCEAMMVGLPVVALATTEIPTVIRDGESGFVDTSVERLIDAMRLLIADPGLARELGEQARRVAVERFSIARFARDWNRALQEVTDLGPTLHVGAGVAPSGAGG